MKRFLTIILSLFALLSICLLSSCGGGGGGDSSGTTKTADDGGTSVVTTLTGTVADGYLRDARVFLDRNNNRVYDNGEPTAQSAAGGVYSLNVNPGDGDLYPVVVQVVAGQTVDEDTGAPVAHSYLLESPPGHWQFVSPLTTLVQIERSKNPSFTELQAVLSVRTQLGIADEVSLFNDYLSTAAVTENFADEYIRTHAAAQIIAGLMGTLKNAILQNLGGEIAADEQTSVAYMVSDQILAHAAKIKQAMNDERNLGIPVAVDDLSMDIRSEIPLETLDASLLSKYQMRLSTPTPTSVPTPAPTPTPTSVPSPAPTPAPEVWDMQPPQVQSQSPPAGDTASIDTVISLSFDEPLDETLLTNGIIELTGPNGLVSGNLDYDLEHIRLTFTPNQFLIPFSNYQVTVRGDLADALGNSLGTDRTWTFTTIFDQTPPPLPDF